MTRIRTRGYVYYDGDTFEREGSTFAVQHPYDDSGEAPWEREDGHGPVSDWHNAENYSGHISKAPGERILCRDRSQVRTYDFAEACRIARRDGWGFLPGDLETFQDESGQWHARVAARYGKPALFECVASDINEAIRRTYAAHRATHTAKSYAAGAAEQDFDRLRAWCNDEWQYLGVVVELLDDNGNGTGETASVWGIESDSYDYLAETAHELADEILANLKSAAA